MRSFRIAVVIAIVALLTACTTPKHAPVTPSPAPSPARLHWDHQTINQPTPAIIDSLRRSVETLGYALVVDGYQPLSETVNDENAPTVLITQWINASADTAVELHSSYGVTAISYKRPSPESTEVRFSWLRCSVSQGLQISPVKESRKLADKSREELLKLPVCHEVTFGL